MGPNQLSPHQVGLGAAVRAQQRAVVVVVVAAVRTPDTVVVDYRRHWVVFVVDRNRAQQEGDRIRSLGVDCSSCYPLGIVQYSSEVVANLPAVEEASLLPPGEEVVDWPAVGVANRPAVQEVPCCPRDSWQTSLRVSCHPIPP